MSTTPSPEPADKPTGDVSGYPLTALFLLTAFCCVLAAVIMQIAHPVVAGEIGLEALLIASVGGALLGMLLGAIMGLAQRLPVVGMLIGGPTGLVLGAIIGPLVLLPSNRLSDVLTTIVGGSVVLVLFAVTMRAIGNRISPELRPTDAGPTHAKRS